MTEKKSDDGGDEEFPDIHDLTDVCGGFGPWQKTILLLAFLTNYPAACHNLGYAFFSYSQDHWCKRPPAFENMTLENWKNWYIPKEMTDGQEVLSQCRMYRPNGTDGETISCTNGWEYDRSVFKASTVDTWNLVCSQEWLASASQSVYMAGFLTVVLVCGQLGDRYGRRPVLLFCILLLQLSSTIILFSNSYIFYTVMRFLVGFGAAGVFTIAFVIMVEVCEPKKKTALGMVFAAGFGIFGTLMALFAYLIRHWLYLQMVITIPSYGLLAFWWLMPESPRWLLTQNRREEAIQILEKAAEKNGKSTAEIYVNIKAFSNYLDKKALKEDNNKKVTILDLFKTSNMRKKTLIMFFSWCVISFVYYGLSLNTSDLGGDPFFTFALTCAVELPAILMSFFLLKYIGRRKLLTATLIAGGVACIMIIPVEQILWGRITLAMVGKFCVAASFAIVYVYAAELFPTVVRNVGVGSSSTCARIGSMVAPFVKDIGKVTTMQVPQGIFGALSIISGLLIIMLPETQNTPVIDTLEEGELFGKKMRKTNKTFEQSRL